jgi:hypothetical protein
MQLEAAIAAALITSGASFLGATLAQLLSHYFTLRRENAEREATAANYQLHLTFDVVSVVSELEALLTNVGILNGPGQFRAPGPDPLPLKNASDAYTKLEFNLYVNPQFMLNMRSFLLQAKEMEQYIRRKKVGKLEDHEVLLVIELYLQGLSYIVGSVKSIREKKKTYISDPTFDEVVSVYHSAIGYRLPDREVFEAAKKLNVELKNAMDARLANQAVE